MDTPLWDDSVLERVPLERPSVARSRLAAAGGAAGVVTPVLMWTAFLLAALLRPGYDLLRDSSSELGQIGSPGSPIFNVAFFLVPGVLTICFGAALATLPGRLWLRLTASLMISLSGVSVLASGLVPMASTSAQLTFWHRFAGLPLLTVLPAGILLLSLGLSSELGWRPCGWLGLLCGFVLVILIGCYRLDVVTIPDGFFQRASLAVLTPWFVAIGLRRMRLNWRSPKGAPA